MLANLRRKIGMANGAPPPPLSTMPPPTFADSMITSPTHTYHDPGMPPPFTMEELGFAWPSAGIVSPAAIPLWLQEQVRSFQLPFQNKPDSGTELGRSRFAYQRFGWNLHKSQEWLDWRLCPHARGMVGSPGKTSKQADSLLYLYLIWTCFLW